MDDLGLSAIELKDIRGRLEWSQQRMADELDVARNTVVRMENGQMAIERRTALAVRYLAWHHAMIEKVQSPRRTGHTALIAMELGDAQHQVDLPLPPADPRDRSDARQAWDVYGYALKDRFGMELLKERYFKLVSDQENSYTYLFLLQLLEKLVSLPCQQDSYPIQWGNIRELTAFARQLYRANPQWH
jgi:DNA-binding XRE family transcriptional regulator